MEGEARKTWGIDIYSTPSRCSPAAFQPADLSHLTLGGNSPFALSVPPRPLAAKLLNLDRGSLPFEQNGPKEDIDDLRVVVRICPL